MTLSDEGRSGGREDDVFRTVAAIARALHVKDAALQPTLDAIVTMAAATTGFQAGLILVSGKALIVQAASGPAAHQLDLAQQRRGQGPCIVAAQRQTTVCIRDTRADERWPDFCAQAVDLGVLGLLCVPLWVHQKRLGTLSLFADQPGAITEHDARITPLFATLAALALADAERAEQLRGAMVSRDLIGQAKGILTEREKITADEAFARLSQVSQRRNVKVSVVVGHLVETGQLLGE
jgi:GAF domain-containing protein